MKCKDDWPARSERVVLLDPKWMRFYAVLTGATFVKVILIAVAYLVGTRLDERFGTYPLFLSIGVLAAVGLGLWWIIRVIDRMKL